MFYSWALLHSNFTETFMNLIAFWYEMSPQRYFWFYGNGTFHSMELSQSCWIEFKVILQMLISLGIFGTFKNCWWLLHLASNIFFFSFGNMYSYLCKRNVWSLWLKLYSCHGKKRDPVYCCRRHIRKIKGGKYHLIDKQSCPAWHFSNPFKDTHSWSSVSQSLKYIWKINY